MRLGVAGVGRIGARHAAVLADHSEVTGLVLYDEFDQRADILAHRLGALSVSSVTELFAAEVDGLVIATATSAHAGLIEAACDAGIPTFCEKPVALDAVRTDQVLRRVTTSAVPVHIGFQRRFDRGYLEARRRLRAGELGGLRRVHVVTADPTPPGAEFISTSGGIFRDCHIHDLDAVRWVTGREIVEVYAIGANRGADYFALADDVDESAAVLTLGDGTLVTLQGSRYNGAGYDVRMELAGTASTYVVGLGGRSPLSSVEPDVQFPERDPWQHFFDRFEDAYVAELDAFIDMVAGRRTSPCTVLDALIASYAADALELSRREHRPVRVAEAAEM